MDNIKTMISRDGKKKGSVTSFGHRCRMEGCTGRKFTVKWEDGKRSFPCVKGVEIIDATTAKIR